MKSKHKSTAVVLLNYNTWRETLEEIRLLIEKANVECKDIIVVDNGSQNESYEELSARKEMGFTLLQSASNSGYAAGNNMGLKYAFTNGYKYALVINNDVLLGDDFNLAKLVDVFEKSADIATVNPDIYSPQGHLFNRDAKRFSFFDMSFGLWFYPRKGRKIQMHDGYAYIYRPQGCCMVLDLEKLAEVDFLDEHTFLYSEEIILAERLLGKGYKCACVPEVKVIHNHSKTVKSALDKKKIKKIQEQSFIYYLTEYRKYGKVKRAVCLFFFRIKQKLTA